MKFFSAKLAILLATVVVAATAALSAKAGANEVIWESLFPPPYTACPEIVIDLACIAEDQCYIPGGSNGVGFQMFSFNGQPNAPLVPMSEPNQTLMIMTVAMGGTKQKPMGAFGGMGGLMLMMPSVQYLSNGTTWVPSLVEDFEFILQTQSMRATDDGRHVLFVGNGFSEAMMLSTDGGETFEVIELGKKVPRPKNCSAPGYVAMVDDQTWYLTAGQFPQDRKDNQQYPGFMARKNSRVDLVRDPKSKKLQYSSSIGRRPQAPSNPKVGDYRCVGYVAMLLKTTDGGQTYTVQYENDNANFAFSQIDCASATHCVAVGSGDTAGAETVIFHTTDGSTWKQVLSIPNSPTKMELLFTIRFQDAQHVWAAGGLETANSAAGLLYHSADGGATWTKYPHLQPNIMQIMDLSFAGAVGFASAMSEFKTATILKYANQSYDGYFVQSQCPTSGCNFLCQNISFPQGMCLSTQGGSIKAFCTAEGLQQHVYETTSCIGSYNVTTTPVNQCLSDGQGGYFENFCDAPDTKRHGLSSIGRQHPFKKQASH